MSGLITVARIALRLKNRMVWWDAFGAAISFACYAIFVPGKQSPSRCPLRIPDIPPGAFVIADGPSFTQNTRVAGYYMGKLIHFVV